MPRSRLRLAVLVALAVLSLMNGDADVCAADANTVSRSAVQNGSRTDNDGVNGELGTGIHNLKLAAVAEISRPLGTAPIRDVRLPVIPVSPAPFPVERGVLLKRAFISLKVEDTGVTVNTEYSVRNDHAERKSIKLHVVQKTAEKLRPHVEPVQDMLEPGQEKTIKFAYMIPVAEDGLKSFRIDPAVFINDLLYNQKIEKLQIKVKLPKTAKKLVAATRPYSTADTTMPDGPEYVWDASNAYVFPLYVKWTTLDVNVSIKKTVRRTLDGIAVTVVIKNESPSNAIERMIIEDTYSPGEVKIEQQTSDFQMVTTAESDPRIAWQKKFTNLRPQEERRVTYSLKGARTLSFLPGTTAKVDGSIVAVSNTVTLSPVPGPVLTPQWRISVLPTGWDFDYSSDDHHINEHGMRIYPRPAFNSATGDVSWTTSVDYADKNHDDDYRWGASYTVLGLQEGYINGGSSPVVSDDGGQSQHAGSYQSTRIKNFQKAAVFFRGWKFNYASDDHHITAIDLRMGSVNYNPTEGKVTWTANVRYQDKNYDDNYTWQYWWDVVAFNDGEVMYTEAGGSASGRNGQHNGALVNDSLKGFKRAVVVPVGWAFKFKDDDHHINEHGFRIRNVSYDPVQGRVTWQAYLNYSDKNFDDRYDWWYNVAVIVFNQGDARVIDKGMFTDNGGNSTKSFTENLQNIFTPITWMNGVKDGSETGIDCGGLSPSKCFQCVENSINPGSAADADYYSLDNGALLSTANWAILEYANHMNQSPQTFYAGDDQANRYIDAISWFVDQHMEWTKDGGSWDGKQSAERTINDSGSRCGQDFCGDCEDHSILRAALLRVLGMSWKCVFSADHHNSVNQGESTCPTISKKDGSGGHTYNLVYYRGKYRIMDYGSMSIGSYSACWDQNTTDNIWNDHYGEHWNEQNKRPIDGKLLMNYPGVSTCPTGNWNWRTYYGDICQ